MKKRLIAALLFATSYVPVAAQEAGTSGKVILFRTGSIKGMIFGCQVYAKGKQLVSLKRSSFFELEVPVGETILSTDTASVMLTMSPNQTRYVECATISDVASVRKELRIVEVEALPRNFKSYKEIK